MERYIALLAEEGETVSARLFRAMLNDKPKLAKELHQLARQLVKNGPPDEKDKIYRRNKVFFAELAKKTSDKKVLLGKGLRRPKIVALGWLCKTCLEGKKEVSPQRSESTPPRSKSEKALKRKIDAV